MKIKAPKRLMLLFAASAAALSSALSCTVIDSGAADEAEAVNYTSVSGTYPEISELHNGVNYCYYSLPGDSEYGEKDFSVVEFDLAKRDLYLDLEMAGQYAGEKATVTDIISKYNAANSGKKTAVAAINADRWMTEYCHARDKDIIYNGVAYEKNMKMPVCLPRGFNVSDGEIISSAYTEHETPYEGDSFTFGITDDYIPFLAQPGVNVSVRNENLSSVFTTDAVNRLPAADTIVIYTDKGCLNNYALDDAYEVVIDFDSDYKFQHGSEITGKVTGIYFPDTDDNPVMCENRIILTARGSIKTGEISEYSIGDKVTISVETYDRLGKYTEYVRHMRTGIGGQLPLVTDGKSCTEAVYDLTEARAASIIGYTETGSLMMVTLDSVISQSSSKNFKINQMPALCKELGLYNALLLNTGSPTTMVILDGNDYKLQCTPGKGSEYNITCAAILSYGPEREAQGTIPPVKNETEKLSALIFNSPGQLKYIGETNNTCTEYDTSENALIITSLTDDNPYIEIRYDIGYELLSADDYKYMVIIYKNPETNSEKAVKGTLYPCCGDIKYPENDKSLSILLPQGSKYRSSTVKLNELPYWNGTLTNIRFKFFDDSEEEDTVYIKSIILCRTEEERRQVIYEQLDGDIPGDLNGDGKVNSKDIIRLMKSIANGETNIMGGDLNGDTKIDSKDIIRLMKYISGQDVQLF